MNRGHSIPVVLLWCVPFKTTRDRRRILPHPSSTPPMRAPAVISALVATLVCSRAASGATCGSQLPDTAWLMVRLDADVRLASAEKTLQVRGMAEFRLDGDTSTTLVLHLNAGRRLFRFRSVQTDGATVEMCDSLPDRPAANVARLLFHKTRNHGDVVRVTFEATSSGRGFLFAIDSTAAYADREAAWYPNVARSDAANKLDANTGPGITRIHMQRHWHSLSNGLLRSRQVTDTSAVESWEVPRPMARSFAAAPWVVASAPLVGFHRGAEHRCRHLRAQKTDFDVRNGYRNGHNPQSTDAPHPRDTVTAGRSPATKSIMSLSS